MAAPMVLASAMAWRREDLLVAALAAPFLRLQSLGSGLGVSNRLGLSKRGGGGRVEVERRSVGDGSIGI